LNILVDGLHEAPSLLVAPAGVPAEEIYAAGDGTLRLLR
jgi:hypothetical protein